MQTNERSAERKVNNDKSALNGLIIIALYIVVSFSMEICNFVALDMGILPTNIFPDIAYWMIFAGLLFLIPSNIARTIISSLMIFLQLALNIANQLLMDIIGCVFYLSQLRQVSDGAEGFESRLINWWVISINVLLFALFLVIAIIVQKKLKHADVSHKRKRFWGIVAGIVCFWLVGGSFAFVGDTTFKNAHDGLYLENHGGESVLWNGMYFKNATFKTLGTFGYYCNDIITQIDYLDKLNNEQLDAIELALTSSTSDTSTYSNIAKDDNLIYILVESFDLFAIDPYNTPNLWKLAYGEDTTSTSNPTVMPGTYFSNFHGYNYTNDSEVVSILGHTTTKNRMYDNLKSVGLSTPYSLPNLFHDAGYDSVNFFHGYSKKFYNRSKLNGEFGYTNVYGLEDSSLSSEKFGDWVSDYDYINDMLEIFIPENKSFFSYYTSITAHGPYDYPNPRFDENKEVFDANYDKYSAYMAERGYYLPTDETYFNYLRQYKSAIMEDDKMVGLIFEELERQNILDKTTIVLFADHNCFYYDMSAIMKECDINKGDIKLHNIPLIIYNDNLTSGVNDTFCSTYDLYPTLCSMFGFEYNTALTHGHDIMSEQIDNSLFVSFKTGVFNENYYTTNLYDIYETNDLDLGLQKEFVNDVLDFFKKQNIIENIYKVNYFKSA